MEFEVRANIESIEINRENDYSKMILKNLFFVDHLGTLKEIQDILLHEKNGHNFNNF